MKPIHTAMAIEGTPAEIFVSIVQHMGKAGCPISLMITGLANALVETYHLGLGHCPIGEQDEGMIELFSAMQSHLAQLQAEQKDQADG